MQKSGQCHGVPASQHGNGTTTRFLAVTRSAPDEDHHRTLAAATHKPPSDWKGPSGRPNQTWLRTIESDLRPLNIGPSYAWKKAASRELWRSIVDTATLKKNMPRRQRERRECYPGPALVFFRAMLCIRGTSHGPVSVCPSVTSRCSTKTANKQHHTIAQGL